MNYRNQVSRPATKGFKCVKPSLTVPAQVLDVRTIRERFSRGQSVTTYHGVYDSPLPPGYENLSALDKIDAARENKRLIRKMQADLQAKAQADAVTAKVVESVKVEERVSETETK